MRYQMSGATLALMRLSPVIPVLTLAEPAAALDLAGALIAGGLRVLEITLRTPGALKAVALLAKAFPEARIGAGTIVEPDQIEAAAAAGAAFLVSPGMSPGLIKAAVRSPVPFLPGASTASEAMALHDRGFSALKFFPAEAAGGVRFLASLKGPLPGLVFCPTGGIDAEKAKAYLQLGNVACVGGSWMAAPELIEAKDFARIQSLSREACALAPDAGSA
jgi:2-dehydro-3-deoxyphosphogluconate aldolase/(4S)-4-hydroxy-2-oxoglutarate aldolase